MKVYYNSGLWDESQGRPGREQRVDLGFYHKGLRRIIPSIYHFPQGIVFDILTRLDGKKVMEFYESYRDREDDLTDQERRIAEQEHPYQSMDISEIWLNGKRMEEGYSSTGFLYMEGLNGSREKERIKDLYQDILGDADCFGISRYLVPYPRSFSGFQRILQTLGFYRLRELKLYSHPIIRFYPLEQELVMDEDLKETAFYHPLRQMEYKLYFQNPQPIEIHNLHLLHAMYEIEPALPEGEVLQFRSSMENRLDIGEGDHSSTSSSIGIIGGADGPTSIFMTRKGKVMKLGQRGLALHNALSIPSLEKEDLYSFLIEGINIKIKDREEYSFKIK